MQVILTSLYFTDNYIPVCAYFYYKYGRRNKIYQKERMNGSLLQQWSCPGRFSPFGTGWTQLGLVRKSSTFCKVNPGRQKESGWPSIWSASVTSGKLSEIQARIKVYFYIHCSSKSLNLFLVDTVKAVPEAEFFSPIEKLYAFTSESAIRPKWQFMRSEISKGPQRGL